MDNLFMLGDFMLCDNNETSKYGIDKLDFMVRFIRVLEGEQTKEEYALFKLWLRSKLKRELTNKEEYNLAKCILDYIRSEESSNERLESMQYLFSLKFLIEENN